MCHVLVCIALLIVIAMCIRTGNGEEMGSMPAAGIIDLSADRSGGDIENDEIDRE